MSKIIFIVIIYHEWDYFLVLILRHSIDTWYRHPWFSCYYNVAPEMLKWQTTLKPRAAVHFGVATGSDEADFLRCSTFLSGWCTCYVVSASRFTGALQKLYEFFRKTRRSFHSFLVSTPSALFWQMAVLIPQALLAVCSRKYYFVFFYFLEAENSSANQKVVLMINYVLPECIIKKSIIAFPQLLLTSFQCMHLLIRIHFTTANFRLR